MNKAGENSKDGPYGQNIVEMGYYVIGVVKDDV